MNVVHQETNRKNYLPIPYDHWSKKQTISICSSNGLCQEEK